MNAKEGFLLESKSLARVINESIGIISSSKNLETIKSRYELIEKYVDRLIEIDNMGYSFTEKPPREMKNRFPGAINSRLLELAETEFKEAVNKKDTITTTREGIKLIEKTKQLIIEIRNMLYKNDDDYNEVYKKVDDIHTILKKEAIIGQIKELLEKADKETFKGNKKKAESYYMDALYLIKNCEYSSEFSQSYDKSINIKLIDLKK
jgi:hypothetical protein